MEFQTALSFFGRIFYEVIGLAYGTAGFWAPVGLAVIAGYVWVYYARAKFLAEQKTILLEVKLPKETYKSPLAMELALTGFNQTIGESTWYDRYVLGKIRAWFSLEMVSIEGNVRFFIWTQDFFRKTIESHLYSQYPTIEIHEASDYTRRVPFGRLDSDWGLFGTEYALTKEDPYPIKSYVDYGLEKDPKEEYKVDPLTPVIEFLGSLGRGEQAWIQILVRANKDTNRKPGGLFGKKADWKKEAQELAKKKRDEYGKPADPEAKYERILTKEQTEEIAAIERSVKKPGFDVGIRMVYLAKGDAFNAANIPGIIGAFKQFNSPGLNGFKPSNTTGARYPWQNMFNEVAKKRAKIFNAYIRRSWFHPPYRRIPFVLNSEELATLFHFPGTVAETPTFARIESKKVEPPPNLPL